MRTDLKVGCRVRFEAEKRPFTIRAADDRFAVCTKPFNLRRTTFYTIIDLKRGVRGTENLIFGEGFETDEQCSAALARLRAGETEVSYRNYVGLDIVEVRRNS